MTDAQEAEGWYRDPYGIHEDRWFSVGKATSLVRDDGVESHDDPPNEPLPGPPMEIDTVDPYPKDDLRRADEVDANSEPYNPEEVSDAAFDASTWGAVD